MGWTAMELEFKSQYRQDFSPLHFIRTSFGAHLASYPLDRVLEALSPGIKQPGHEADHSPPTSAKVKSTWIYTSTPPYLFMA
jgi:hypothetical protein